MRYKLLGAATACGALAALALGLVACGSSDEGAGSTPSPKASTVTVEVSTAAEAKTLSVHVGDIIDISLPGNPSTGYMWQAELDEDGVVETAGEPTFKAESDLDGASGVVTIPLKAVKAGGALVVLKEMPPGKDDATPAHVSTVYVDVQEGTRAARVKINESYISETAMMHEGDTLEVTLHGASASTGYVWQVDEVTSGALAQAGQPQVSAQGEQPGAPDLTTFSFKGAAAGQATVVFSLRAPGSNRIAGIYAVTAEVVPSATPGTVQVDATTAERGIVTHLVEGGTLEVVVKGNPTTGYGWSMQATPEGALVPQGEPDFEPDGDAMGAGGTLTYTFAVKGTGGITLDAAYHDQSSGSTGPLRSREWQFESVAPEKPIVVRALEKKAAPLVPLHVGDRLQIHLKGQAGTAYNWVVETIDTGVLKQVGQAKFTAESSEPGAAGIVTLTFEAVGAGGTTPVLLHAAQGQAPESTFAFRAAVAKGARHKTFEAVIFKPGEPVELKAGDTLAVQLPGNPATGYEWMDATPDNAILIQDGDPTFEPESDAMGAPGIVTMKWSATGPGSELVLAMYKPVGEVSTPDQDVVPEAVWSTWVTVKK